MNTMRVGTVSVALFLVVLASVSSAQGQTTYRIINVKSGKVLMVADSSADTGAGLLQGHYTGNSSQHWSIERTVSGCKITNQHSRKVLDLPDSFAEQGVQVIQ